MSATTVDKMSLRPDQLNPTDKAILRELSAGRVTAAYVAEKNNYTGGNVRNRLSRLVEHGHVDKLDGGLYELVDDPRSEE